MKVNFEDSRASSDEKNDLSHNNNKWNRSRKEDFSNKHPLKGNR